MLESHAPFQSSAKSLLLLHHITMVECPWPGCYHVFSSASERSRHLNAKHRGLKPPAPGVPHAPVKCPVDKCTNYFNSTRSSQEHYISRHTPNRFWCECGKSYNRRSDLYKHAKKKPECKLSLGVQPRQRP